MSQALKVINFEQNNSDIISPSVEKSTQIAKPNSLATKLLVLANLVLTLSLLTLFILQIEHIQQNRIIFLLSVISSISLATFILGSLRKNEKSFELKVINNKNDSANKSTEVLLNDSIIPYFQLSRDGDFICKNKSLSSLLKIDSSSSFNFFNDFVKKNKIKKHILLKLENKGKLENYRLKLTNKKNEKIYVSMSCKYSKTDKTLEGSLTDITSQRIKEKSIAEEIERLKTEVLISKEEANKNIPSRNEEETSQLIHDLKSPLNSIFGFLTLIENQHYETDEELVEFSQSAKIAGENLLKTIDEKFEIETVENENIIGNNETLLEENTFVEDQNLATESIIDFTMNDFDVQMNSGPNLLLVEDNPMNQQVEIKLLEKAGYNVFAIETGEEAIEQVKTNKFDLVLMDIDLPGMNGLEATKEIRNLAQHLSNIPVIAATAKSSMKDREKCLDAGMNDYISKPINISFMKMTIDQWLKQKVA